MTSERFSRQSFLGEHSQAAIERATVGVVGLGGGGGHVAQQLAHIGFLKYRLFDDDFADESNLNRLVTATETDIIAQTLKVELAKRRILSVRGGATVDVFAYRWQERSEALRGCDIVFGCVDGFTERRELQLRQGLNRYFGYYNEERHHQALDYRTPGAVYREGRGEGRPAG